MRLEEPLGVATPARRGWNLDIWQPVRKGGRSSRTDADGQLVRLVRYLLERRHDTDKAIGFGWIIMPDAVPAASDVRDTRGPVAPALKGSVTTRRWVCFVLSGNLLDLAWKLPFDPNFAVCKELFFPNRDDLFKRIDGVLTRFKRNLPVSRGDNDGHANFANFQSSQSMNDA